MNKRADTLFYKIGLFIWMPVLLFGIWFSNYGFSLIQNHMECYFLKSTGLPCPGCGGTRAFVLLFRGRLFYSLIYHPAVLTMVVLYLHFMLLYFYRKYISHTIAYREINIPVYAYIFIGVLILQWIVKLVMIFSHISI